MQLEYNENGFSIMDSSLWGPIRVNVRGNTIDYVIKVFSSKKPRGYRTDTKYWSYHHNHCFYPTDENDLEIRQSVPSRFFKDVVRQLKEKRKNDKRKNDKRNDRGITHHTKQELLEMNIPALNTIYNNLYSWQ